MCRRDRVKLLRALKTHSQKEKLNQFLEITKKGCWLKYFHSSDGIGGVMKISSWVVQYH